MTQQQSKSLKRLFIVSFILLIGFIFVFSIPLSIFYLILLFLIALWILLLIQTLQTFMKSKILKTYAIWVVILCTVVCLIHYLGYDDESFLLSFFTFEPIFYKMIYSEMFRDFMIDDEGILVGAYIVRIGTGFIYGGMLDAIRFTLKKI